MLSSVFKTTRWSRSLGDLAAGDKILLGETNARGELCTDDVVTSSWESDNRGVILIGRLDCVLFVVGDATCSIVSLSCGSSVSVSVASDRGLTSLYLGDLLMTSRAAEAIPSETSPLLSMKNVFADCCDFGEGRLSLFEVKIALKSRGDCDTGDATSCDSWSRRVVG